MKSFSALYFGPGLPAQGKKITVQIESEGLRLWCHEIAGEVSGEMPGKISGEVPGKLVAYHEIRVSAGGFDHEQIILMWIENDKTWSLNLVDQPAKDILLAEAPPALALQLSQWKKNVSSTRRRMRAGWWVLTLFLLSPVILLGLFLWQADRVIDWAVSHVSIENEQKLGDMIFEQYRPTLKLITQGEAPRAIAEIGEKLGLDAPYKFKWHVADNPAVNAFAIPGGHIVVFTGLIKAAQTPEEVTGVLAHEIQHVVQRHSLKAMIHNLGWRATIAIVTGDLSGGMAGEMATQLGVLKYGRDKETEADMQGLALLKKVRVDPNGMVQFFETLARQSGAPIELLSTHPSTTERITALREAIRQQGPWHSQPLPYNWNAVKASLSAK